MEVKQVCGPMDFGIENLALPNHLNVSLITASGGVVKANSLVISYNGSVFKRMFEDQEPCYLVHLSEYTKYVVDCFVKILYSGRVDFGKLLFKTEMWRLAERFDVKWLLERFNEHSLNGQAYFDQQQTQRQLQDYTTSEEQFNEHSEDQAYFEQQQTQRQLQDNSTFKEQFNEHSEDQAYFEHQQTQRQLQDNSTFKEQFNEHSEDQAYFEQQETQRQLQDNPTFKQQFNEHSEDQAYFEHQLTQPQLQDNSTFKEQFNEHSEDESYLEQQQTQRQLQDNSTFKEQFNEHSEDQAYFEQQQTQWPLIQEYTTSKLYYGEKLEFQESTEKRRRLLPQEKYCHRDVRPLYRYPHKEIASSSSCSTRSTYDKMIKYVASKQARSIYKRTVEFTEVSIIHRPIEISTNAHRSNNARACDDTVVDNVIGTASIPNLVFSLPNELDTFLPSFVHLDGFLDYLFSSSFSFQNMFMFIEFVFIVKRMPCTYKLVEVSELKKDLVELTQRIVDIRKRYGWRNVPKRFF